MQVATILPTAYLPMIENEKYHMCLAHLIGKDKKYTEFYQKIAQKEDNYVIMDNGVIEGNQRPIDELVKKATLVGADEMILPDVYMDEDATLEHSYDALDYIQQFYPSGLDLKLMAVPQGKTLDEWLECANIMIGWDIDCLGIPKVLTKIVGRDGRLEALKALGNKVRGLDIHLLGCWNSPIEIMLIEKAAQAKIIKPVRGVDSAIAWVYARNAMLMNEDDRPYALGVNFDDISTDMNLLQQNIDMWKEAGKCDKNEKVIKLFYRGN
jgi:hypothetical protein